MSNDPLPIIALLTDFGEDDSYVGAMKGVMLGILPHVRLVDISHRITPQNIREAALALSNVYKYYPAHTVHLVVIDPGVGGPRRAIAVETSQGRFVAPDNGVLSYVVDGVDFKAVELADESYWLPSPSHTFHGRDVFSPVAAHIASGVPLEKLGPTIDDIIRLPPQPLKIDGASIQGTAVHIDHFGNVLTNIETLRWLDDASVEFQSDGQPPRTLIADKLQITCGWHTIKGLNQTYGQANPGQMLALVGSRGELEIAVNQGDAAEKLAIEVGAPITLRILS